MLALADSKHNILALAFSPCAFLVLQYFFLRHLTCLLVLLFCCCVSCCVVSVVLLIFFRVWCDYLGVVSLLMHFSDAFIFYCVVDDVFDVFWALFVVLLFCCCCPPWPCVSEYAPRDLLCPHTRNFPCPLCHTTPVRPKQPMCDHLRPLCARTHGYDCAHVCLRFCVFVACTARVRMPVFGLAGAYMFVFCAF